MQDHTYRQILFETRETHRQLLHCQIWSFCDLAMMVFSGDKCVRGLYACRGHGVPSFLEDGRATHPFIFKIRFLGLHPQVEVHFEGVFTHLIVGQFAHLHFGTTCVEHSAHIQETRPHWRKIHEQQYDIEKVSEAPQQYSMRRTCANTRAQIVKDHTLVRIETYVGHRLRLILPSLTFCDTP